MKNGKTHAPLSTRDTRVRRAVLRKLVRERGVKSVSEDFLDQLPAQIHNALEKGRYAARPARELPSLVRMTATDVYHLPRIGPAGREIIAKALAALGLRFGMPEEEVASCFHQSV